ncbi:MAG: CxxC-x17-CxxC domain-containing protein [Candidatus Kerfeldbacteria bacterium]
MYDRKEMFRTTCSDCGDSCEVPFKPTGSKPVLCSSCFGQQGGGRSNGRDNRSGGGRGGRFGGRDNRSGGRDRGDREMHSVICDDCGDNCQVPFRPTAGKPIYCDKCFGKHNDRGGRGGDRKGGDSFREKRGGGNNDKMANELSSMNSKLDRLITLLDPSAKSEKKTTPKKVKDETVAPLDLDLDVKPKAKTAKKTVKKKAVAKKPAKKTVKKKK